MQEMENKDSHTRVWLPAKHASNPKGHITN